jgi:hypothetical protein
LIATLGQRQDRFAELINTLMPQVDRHDGVVTVSALWNNGERPLGEVRQDLLEHATSTYVSFVDDDDEVPDYFVSEVVERLDGDVDYVGWQLQCYLDGKAVKPTYHSIRYDHWFDDRRGYYRDVSHLNPIRRELALTVNYRHVGAPEDVHWANQLRGSVKTEAYVDKVMYHYRSSAGDSTWRFGSVDQRRAISPRHVVSSPYFSYHPNSSR